MILYAIMVKQRKKPALKFLTGMTNGHIPSMTGDFNKAITFTEKKDAFAFVEQIKRYEGDLEFAGVNTDEGCFIVTLELGIQERIPLSES